MNPDDPQSLFWDVVDCAKGIAQVTMWLGLATIAVAWAVASVVFVTTH